MHFKLAELFSLSFLERNRIKAPASDPMNVAPFAELENIISKSLTAPEVKTAPTLQAQKIESPAGMTVKNPLPSKHMFQDEALMERLLKYRDQIPTSGRIIRASDS